jgi:SNF2 family DNA or RNA helicase
MAKSRIHVLEALLRLRQAACHPALLNAKHAEESSAKIEALVLHLTDLLAEGHKALVFSQFTSFLAIVRKELDQRGIAHEYLDGQTRNRRERIEHFQNDPSCGVFLISLKAGGLGLNLTAADYVFLLDPWWNPAVEMQAIDRAHRIGQSRQVFAYRLICKNTVEEKIAELQTRKKELADAILQADNSLLTDLTADDLELLLG